MLGRLPEASAALLPPGFLHLTTLRCSCCACTGSQAVCLLPLPCRLLSSPRGLLLLFMLLWWLSQWFTKRQS